MKKRFFILLITILVITATAIPVSAKSVNAGKVYVTDESGKLSSQQLYSLNTTFEEISRKYGYDVVGIITDGHISTVSYAAYRYYNDSGYKENGMILLIDDKEGEYNFQPFGILEKTVNEDALDYIEDAILPHLKKEDYSHALHTFAEKTEELYELAKQGKVYKKPFKWIPSTLIALGIGFLIAFLVTSSMKRQLNNVQKQIRAESYVRSGSMAVNESRDLFLYHTVIRTPRPKSNSSGGRSSGGGNYGGGGRSGSFR